MSGVGWLLSIRAIPTKRLLATCEFLLTFLFSRLCTDKADTSMRAGFDASLLLAWCWFSCRETRGLSVRGKHMTRLKIICFHFYTSYWNTFAWSHVSWTVLSWSYRIITVCVYVHRLSFVIQNTDKLSLYTNSAPKAACCRLGNIIKCNMFLKLLWWNSLWPYVLMVVCIL